MLKNTVHAARAAVALGACAALLTLAPAGYAAMGTGTVTARKPLLHVAAAPAAGTSASPAAANPQQDRMRSCNADAGSRSLKGAARSGFMKDCLAGKAAPASGPASTPQQRMKDCNAQAATRSLTGDSRKSFMSTCLKAG